MAPLYSDKGRPGIESRFVIGLLLLKHMFGLSDEGVCERWVYDPYFQHFTGEEFFQHTFPHERSDLSHWRKRLGDKLDLLLAESLRVAHDSGALRTRDLARVTVDTTVQPKNIAFPTDARLLHAAIKGLNRLARRHGGAAPAILSARRQAGGDDGGTLCPRQAVQSPSSGSALPAHPPGPADPRYPPQDRRPRARRGGLRGPAVAGLPDPLFTAPVLLRVSPPLSTPLARVFLVSGSGPWDKRHVDISLVKPRTAELLPLHSAAFCVAPHRKNIVG